MKLFTCPACQQTLHFENFQCLGVHDAYPFVLPEPAIEKLRFVHDVIARAAEAR